MVGYIHISYKPIEDLVWYAVHEFSDGALDGQTDRQRRMHFPMMRNV